MKRYFYLKNKQHLCNRFMLVSILPNPLPEEGLGRITRVYLVPFMVSYKIIIFCMKKRGVIDNNDDTCIFV